MVGTSPGKLIISKVLEQKLFRRVDLVGVDEVSTLKSAFCNLKSDTSSNFCKKQLLF